jgi:hypothetical protein
VAVDAKSAVCRKRRGRHFFIVRSSPNNDDGVAMMVVVVMMVATMVVRLRVSRSRNEGEESKCHELLHARLDARVARRRCPQFVSALF